MSLLAGRKETEPMAWDFYPKTDDPETRHYRARYLQKDNPTAD